MQYSYTTSRPLPTFLISSSLCLFYPSIQPCNKWYFLPSLRPSAPLTSSPPPLILLFLLYYHQVLAVASLLLTTSYHTSVTTCNFFSFLRISLILALFSLIKSLESHPSLSPSLLLFCNFSFLPPDTHWLWRPFDPSSIRTRGQITLLHSTHPQNR